MSTKIPVSHFAWKPIILETLARYAFRKAYPGARIDLPRCKLLVTEHRAKKDCRTPWSSTVELPHVWRKIIHFTWVNRFELAVVTIEAAATGKVTPKFENYDLVSLEAGYKHGSHEEKVVLEIVSEER